MTPDSLSSFERMLVSFVYKPRTAVVGGGGDTIVGRTGMKQKKTEEEATRKRDKRTPAPAPPKTPPRPLYTGRRLSAGPQQDGTMIADGTAAESKVTMPRETVAHEAVATTSATAEGERLRQRWRRLIPPAGSRTQVVLPPCKGKPQNSCSAIRKDVDGNPAIVSRFFRHQPSASTGRNAKYEQIELTEEGKDEHHVDLTNSSKRKMRRTSRPLKENRGEEHKARKSKKKKIVVVSPYFTTSSGQRVREVGAEGVGEEVEVVVQRRTKKRTIPATEFTAEAPASSSCDQDHSRRVEGKKKRKPKHPSVQLTAAERMYDAYKRVPRDNPWVPPFSDHELLQEIHFFDHWRVLVICMLLNRTTGREVLKILRRLFLLCPDAETTTKVSEEDIEELIRPLGLQKKRSKMIKRMSEEYLGKEWTHVTQLHGIGKYAADAYAIFCSGTWKEVKPNDHKLVDYWRFLLSDNDGRESITVQRST